MEKATKLSQVQNVFLAEPLKTKEEMKKFHVDTSVARYGSDSSSMVDELSIELTDCTDAYIKKLFIGHMGSGKSTELRKLEETLQENGFFTVFIESDKEIDVNDAEYIDILFLIIEKILHNAKDHNLEISDKLYERLQHYWLSVTDIEETKSDSQEAILEMEASTGVNAFVFKLLANIKGILKSTQETRQIVRRRIEPRSSELINQIIDVAKYITKLLEADNSVHSIPVIILDGTDKLPLDAAKKIFHDNGIKFSDLPIHFIVSFPIALSYAPEYGVIQSWFSSPCKLPMIKQRKWIKETTYDKFPEGPRVMKHIVACRMNLNLFESGVLEHMIEKTGGNIRDLFRCIKKSAVRARIKKEDIIVMEYAEYALNELKSDINGRYESSDIAELTNIYRGDKARTGDPSIIKLLQTGAVMEYNSSRWCDLHPLVEDWLIETGRIKAFKGIKDVKR